MNGIRSRWGENLDATSNFPLDDDDADEDDDMIELGDGAWSYCPWRQGLPTPSSRDESGIFSDSSCISLSPALRALWSVILLVWSLSRAIRF